MLGSIVGFFFLPVAIWLETPGLLRASVSCRQCSAWRTSPQAPLLSPARAMGFRKAREAPEGLRKRKLTAEHCIVLCSVV